MKTKMIIEGVSMVLFILIFVSGLFYAFFFYEDAMTKHGATNCLICAVAWLMTVLLLAWLSIGMDTTEKDRNKTLNEARNQREKIRS